MCVYSQQLTGDARVCSHPVLTHQLASCYAGRSGHLSSQQSGGRSMQRRWRQVCSLPVLLVLQWCIQQGLAHMLAQQVRRGCGCWPCDETLHTYLSHPPAATLQGRLGRSWWITSAPTSRSTARTWAVWRTCRCEGTLHTNHTPGTPGCARSVQSLCGEHSSAPLFGPKVPRALSAPGSLSA